MSIQVIVKFKLHEARVDAFIETLQAAKESIIAAPGCDNVELLHSQDDPTLVVLLESWQSLAIHDEYAAKMQAAGANDRMGEFLAGPTVHEVYTIK